MNGNVHQRAREWVQMRLDGTLASEQASALNSHLEDCEDCRAYAARLERLDSELREGYQQRSRDAQPASRLVPDMQHSLYAIQNQMRHTMRNRQIMKIANSFSSVLILTVLIIGMTWLISTRGHVIFPGTGSDTGATLTPTAFPWTEQSPLSSAARIEAILNDLAQRNVDALHGAAWVHILGKDLGQPGMLPLSFTDSWFHYPAGSQSCTESVVFVRDRPETSTQFLQILVQLPDGTTGDLIQLRSGKGQITHATPGSAACDLRPESTSAGQLAARLKSEQDASPNQAIAVKAWYAMYSTKPVFMVSATFTQPSKANAAGILRETLTFDADNGLLLQEGTRMERPDGSLFGESLEGYETEFLSAPPDDVALQIGQLSAELKADAMALQPVATRTPETSPVPLVEDQQFIPESSPLTDGQTILRILRALKQVQVERLSQPGWYIYGPEALDPDQWMNNRYLLTHAIDPNGSCDYMSYYIKDGRILPQEIVLANGRWGLIGPVEGGQLTPGETGKIHWSNGPASATCTVANTETVSFIQNETDYFESMVDGRLQGSYKAWTEGQHGRKFMVLYSEKEGSGLGTVMDPDTRKLEPIQKQKRWVYFDLNWGTVVSEDQVFMLQNGKTIGTAPSAGKTIAAGYTYYKELPPDVQEAYNKAVAKLEATLLNK